MQDLEIVALYKARDESAIQHTADKYGNYCEKIAMNILCDTFDSQECVNDTYLHTWNSIPPSEPTNLASYLGKIVRNLAIDKYRIKSAKKREANEFALVLEEAEYLAFQKDDVQDRLNVKILGEKISLFLKMQKELTRRIFVLRYFYLDSIETISKKFGISEEKTKSILFRTRNKLKEFLEKEGLI